MRFNYEEAELLNLFIEGIVPVPTKAEIIALISDSKPENENPELTSIVSNTILKLNGIDDVTYSKIVSNLPVDTYTLY
jgi:hypothetical protein